MTRYTLDELEEDITQWMIRWGPDGHCDGANIIARKVWDKYIRKVRK